MPVEEEDYGKCKDFDRSNTTQRPTVSIGAVQQDRKGAFVVALRCDKKMLRNERFGDCDPNTWHESWVLHR
jgi:hypothetical protein